MIIRKSIIVPRINHCPFNKPYGYIYLYTNRFNGHKYIGKHKFDKPYIDLSYKGSGTHHWKNAVNKYTWDGFTKEVLFWLNYNPKLSLSAHNDILNAKEIYFIDIMGTFDNPSDYNETRGGDGISSDLMSGSNNPMYGKKGVLSPTYGMRGELSPWWGKTHTKEQKDKIRQANTGKIVSQETRDKISLANSGRIGSDKQKEIVSKLNKEKIGCKNPMWKGGKIIVNPVHSDFMKGKHLSKNTEFTTKNSSGGNNLQAKPVVQLTDSYELVKEYDYLGGVKPDFNEESVRRCCKGKQAKTKGFRWMYKEDYLKMLEGGNNGTCESIRRTV